MSTSYNGPERRIHSDDHDTIVTVLSLIDSHIKNYNDHKVVFKEHKDDFRMHMKEDNDNFRSIIKELWEIKKYGYIALGIYMALQGIPTLINIIKSIHAG